jgi:hypothetical protein
MRIIDGTMKVELEATDPRAVRIRAILFSQPAATDPIGKLWAACSAPQRDVLVAIAEGGEITQADLERTLGLNAVALRGRNSGLAKIAKRESVEYPIRAIGGRRESRRFSLEPEAVRRILRLNSQTPKSRRKP